MCIRDRLESRLLKAQENQDQIAASLLSEQISGLRNELNLIGSNPE